MPHILNGDVFIGDKFAFPYSVPIILALYSKQLSHTAQQKPSSYRAWATLIRDKAARNRLQGRTPRSGAITPQGFVMRSLTEHFLSQDYEIPGISGGRPRVSFPLLRLCATWGESWVGRQTKGLSRLGSWAELGVGAQRMHW